LSEKIKRTPSLLEPESTGGDIAATGLDFQAYLILCKIPYWLSYEGFSSVIWEGIGDIEAKFFAPGKGQVIEAIEAKNHDLTPVKFWEEIERFKRMDEGSPGTYRWFTLSCTGLSDNLQPLVNGLRRLRDPYPFYDTSSGVFQNSYEDYKEKVKKLGKNDEMAEFLFHKVLIEDKWGSLNDKAKGIFKDEFFAHLPEFDIRSREQEKVFENLLVLVRSQKNKPASRIQLIHAIHSAIDEENIPSKPVLINTALEEIPEQGKELQFLWKHFFGGSERIYPPASEWNARMYQELLETKKWIQENRSTRKVRLSGNRRISASLAIGSVFSAVSGFVIEAEQRDGQIWSTDSYANEKTPNYEFSTQFEKRSGKELILTIGITRESIAPEVIAYLQGQDLLHFPKLHLFSQIPIVSAEQANLAADKIKKEIKRALNETKANRVHLFYAGPAHLALFLGHRWNALAPLQCYEWVSTGQYIPTCSLEVK
jgi:hypothetical protein